MIFEKLFILFYIMSIMNFGREYKLLKGYPVRETNFSVIYPVSYHGRLFDVHIAKDPAENDNFRNHARVQRTLNHPGILKTFHLGENNEHRYFALKEHVDMPLLSERISSASLSNADKLKVLYGVAQTINYAHSRGQVHGALGSDAVFYDGTDLKVDSFGFKEQQKDFVNFFLLSWGVLKNIGSPVIVESEFREKWWPGQINNMFNLAHLQEPSNFPDIEKMLYEAMKQYVPPETDLMDNLNDLNVTYSIANGKINSIDLDKASELIKGKHMKDLEKFLLQSSLLVSAPVFSELIRDFGTDPVADAVVEFDPASVCLFKDKHLMTNSFAIALADKYPAKSAEIFSYLLSSGHDNDETNNNLGVALAIGKDQSAVKAFGRSRIETARLNSALFSLARGDYQNTINEIRLIRDNPFAIGIAKTLKHKLGLELTVQEHSRFEMRLLSQRFADRLSRRGVVSEDYQWAA